METILWMNWTMDSFLSSILYPLSLSSGSWLPAGDLVALTAALIRWAPRLGLVDYPSDRKVHTRPTPRGGGLAIFAAVSVVFPLSSKTPLSLLSSYRLLALAT